MYLGLILRGKKDLTSVKTKIFVVSILDYKYWSDVVLSSDGHLKFDNMKMWTTMELTDFISAFERCIASSMNMDKVIYSGRKWLTWTIGGTFKCLNNLINRHAGGIVSSTA